MIGRTNVWFSLACFGTLSVLLGAAASVQTVDDELIQPAKQQGR